MAATPDQLDVQPDAEKGLDDDEDEDAIPKPTDLQCRIIE